MAVQFDNIGEVKPKVTAGGKDKIKFVPNLNVSFFNDEFYFNLNRKDKIITNEKSVTASGKTSLGGIDTDIWYIDDKGRFKWDIEFASRPAVNSWTWELKHTKGIEFYYQGELTAEEIADGCERPDEVVGSYAVYCNKANNKYKTGKLCHIYRPFCYDAKGNTIYADLNIADGQLTITIDTKWLDSAVYPVRLDPTIGYTSIGASIGGNSSAMFTSKYTVAMSEAGTASKIYVYMRGTSDSNFGYYSDSSGNPSSLVDGNKTVAISSARWYSADVSGALSSGAKYYPSFSCNYNDYYYDSGNLGDGCYVDYGSYTMPSSYGTPTQSSLRRSIYLEYTESGGSSGNGYYYQQQQM